MGRSGLIQRLKTLARIFSESTRSLLRDDCLTYASSVSFYFLLSMIPFSTLSLAVYRWIQSRLTSSAASFSDTAGMLAENLNQIVPFISEEWLLTYVVNPNPGSSLRIITILVLPLISGAVFGVLDLAYRRIFRIPPRHLLKGQMVSALLAIFLVLLLFLTSFMLSILSPAAKRLLELTPYFAPAYETALGRIVLSRANLIAPAALFLFYLVSVKIFLRIPIQWKHRLLTATVFCLLWLIARFFFGLYIDRLSRVNVIYGSLSSIVIILIWIYYSSVALLFSVEMMYIVHTGRHLPLNTDQRSKANRRTVRPSTVRNSYR